MTNRHTADTITDDQLDQLYTRIGELSAGCGQLAGAVHHNRRRAEHAEAQLAAVRALHHDDYGLCGACTNSHGVPWPCPTITALDGPAAPAAVKAMPLVAVSQEDVADWALRGLAAQPAKPTD